MEIDYDSEKEKMRGLGNYEKSNPKALMPIGCIFGFVSGAWNCFLNT